MKIQKLEIQSTILFFISPFFSFPKKNPTGGNKQIKTKQDRTGTVARMTDENTVNAQLCTASAPFFGFMGVTSALVFASKCGSNKMT